MLETWLVEYYEGSIPQYFLCEAEDKRHAIEQCLSAYPDAGIGKVGKVSWKLGR